MVWGLFPVDSLSGDEKYYIYTKGTYKVGRKGCDVIISNDKSVSRIHAEVIVDAMVSLEPVESRSSTLSSQVRIRDCSKYGTFVASNSHMKKRVSDCPGKETYLNDGDLISFGTGSGTYRFSYVPLYFHLCNFTSSQGSPLVDKVSSIGAFVAHKWTTRCTHAIVDAFMPVTEDIIDVILSKKPLVLSTWLELVAATRINNELPSCSQFYPTLTLDGRSVIVADTRARDICLKGYTFVLGSANMYRFQERVQLLLEVAGAKVLTVEDLDSENQDRVEAYNSVVLVNPADTAEGVHWGNSLRKVNEFNLISSVLSAYLDPSIFISPSIVVSSSCSTDETVVADTDAESETAASNYLTMTNVKNQNASNERKKTLEIHPSSIHGDCMLESNMEIITGKEGTQYLSKVEKSLKQDALTQRDDKVTRFLKLNREEDTARNDDLESPKGDVLYRQNLVVKSTNPQVAIGSVTADGVMNYKLFRKTKTQSGNSFSNLVPYSKQPYTDSDYDKELSEYVKKEKKRKKMETMAEDLFNHEQSKGRRHVGSVRLC